MQCMYMIGLFLTDYDGLALFFIICYYVNCDLRLQNGVYVHVNRCCTYKCKFHKFLYIQKMLYYKGCA